MLPILLPVMIFGAQALVAMTPQTLWQEWPEQRFVSVAAPCLRPGDLEEHLRRLVAKHPQRLRVEEIGRSLQERPIHLLTVGEGSRKLLLWSQMHGDEPAATPALLDIVDYLLADETDPERRAILEGVTLLLIPMLNPDGAEIYSRRNAQGIDINRDALSLATPEGRILKRVRDTHEPFMGFNLHDQDRRTTVGDTGRLATNAVLAVAGDPAATETPGRLRAKRACAAIVKALAPFVPGGMARYDEDWSPRAFGDNLTAWGTPVVLIESGGLPLDRSFSELTRLNFVAILSVLRDLVADDLVGHDPQIYEDLLRNESDAWTDVVIRGGELLQPGTTLPYRADLAFNVLQDDRAAVGCQGGTRQGSKIFEIGDGRFIAAARDVDARGRVVVAPLRVAVKGWSARAWLDGEGLKRLAKYGVGEIQWQVSGRHLDAARSRALELQRPGRPVIVAGKAPPELPRLSGLPREEESRSLGAILRLLEGGRAPRSAATVWHGLQPFWFSREGAGAPSLIPGRPASFLLLSSVHAQEWTIDGVELDSVWIDGVEVRDAR